MACPPGFLGFLLSFDKFFFHNHAMQMFQKLKQARISKSYSQSELAAKCGITRAAVALWESKDSSKRTYPRPEMLKKLAIIYGIALKHLVDDEVDVDGALEEYTLDDIAPNQHCLLRINAVDFAGMVNGTVLRIVPWDDNSKANAVIVVFKQAGHRRAMLRHISRVGDSITLTLPTIEFSAQANNLGFTANDGEIIAVVRAVAHDPRLYGSR